MIVLGADTHKRSHTITAVAAWSSPGPPDTLELSGRAYGLSSSCCVQPEGLCTAVCGFSRAPAPARAREECACS
jgi:hypothetical protein